MKPKTDMSALPHDDDEHLDDNDWDAPVLAVNSGRLSTVVSVRFSQEELEKVRAASADSTLSEFIRRAALALATAAAPTYVDLFSTNSQPSLSRFISLTVAAEVWTGGPDSWEMPQLADIA
jgi:hypothetical protein